MTSGADKLNVLFLVSGDFGELTRAVFFALEPEFASYLLIRPALHAVHGDDLPVPSQVYESAVDVLAAVERFRPDAVLLFCGYLFAHDGIFSDAELERLVGALLRRGCPVLTSDPFVGWLREIAAWAAARPATDRQDAPRPLETLTAEELEEEQKRFFARDFGRAYALLSPLPHVYDLSPPPDLVSPGSLAHSNHGMVASPGRVPGLAEVRRALGLDPTRPRWVFVVSGEDYRRLTEGGGRQTPAGARLHQARFHELLADQLYEALGQGRQPVLIAPQECTFEVGLRSTPADGVILLPTCRLSWFMALVLEAEYAFYWNMFSHSLKLRTVNQLPFFLADCGHMGRSSNAFLERTARCYYVAGVPPFLDFSQPLDAGELARLAAGERPRLRAMAESFLQPPRPAEALRQFLRDTGQGVAAPVIGRGPAAWAE